MKEKKHKCIICGSTDCQRTIPELDIFENIDRDYKPSLCCFSAFCNIEKVGISEIYQRIEFLKIFRNSIKNKNHPSNIWISGYCNFAKMYQEIKNGEYGNYMAEFIEKEEKKIKRG